MKENVPDQAKQMAKAGMPKKKMGWFRKIFIFLLLVFMAMQFFQPDKNNNDVVASKGIFSVVAMPDTVNLLLREACYDCHSNNTQYPWYSNIQPVGWWLAGHIKDGKARLNFSEFATYEKGRQLKKLKEIKESQQEGWMPLSSYTFIHTDAKLDAGQKKLLMDWADSSIRTVTAMVDKN